MMIQTEMENIFNAGGSPDIVYMTLESAHMHGLIGCWEYTWRRVLRKLRLPQPRLGISKRKGRFGGLSARRTPGTGKTAK